MVHAQHSIYHYLVEKFLSLAISFYMGKLLTTAAGTTEKWKAGANAQKPTRGVVKHCYLKKINRKTRNVTFFDRITS